MSEAAVAEPPVTTDPKGAPPDETKTPPDDGESTDDQAPQQTDEPKDDAPADDDPDAVAAREREEAEAALIDQKAEEKAEARRAEEERTRRESERKEAIKNARVNHITRVDALVASLPKLHDADGTELTINSKAFKDAAEALNLVVEESVATAIADEYRTEINRTLSKEAQEALWKDVGDKTEAGNVLAHYAEHRALETKAVKTADPEALIAANPKLKLHIANEKKASREQGRKDPPGEPSGDTRSASGAAYTLAQIDAMSTSDWMGLGDRDTRQRILDQAHQQAGRR